MVSSNPKIFVGAHASIAMGFCNSLKSIDVIGGNAVQIFLKSPRGGHEKELNDEDLKFENEFISEKNMFLVGHCSYLLNFAKEPNSNMWAINSLIDDLNKIALLKGVGVVLHIGKYLELSRNEAFENIKKSVKIVLSKTPKEVKIIFENTAGQGTEVGFLFSELKEIYDLFSDEEKKRIGFCLDTCHMFAAGYDLSTKMGVVSVFSEFDKLIGLGKIVCIHFNDSLKGLGSKVDRHEDIGFGQIGEIGLKEVAKFCCENGLPIILETPTLHEDYKVQIDKIKGWVLR